MSTKKFLGFLICLSCVTYVSCGKGADKRSADDLSETQKFGFIATCGSSAGAWGDVVYFAGGNSDGDVSVDTEGTVSNSDPNSDKAGRIDILQLFRRTSDGSKRMFVDWSFTKLSIPRGLLGIVGGSKNIFVSGGQLSIRDFLPGGYDFSKNLRKDVDVYDSSHKLIKTISLSEARANVSGYAYRNKVYFVGGFNGKKNEYGNLCASGRCFYRSYVIDVYDEDTEAMDTITMPGDAEGASVAFVEDEMFLAPGGTNFVDRVKGALNKEFWVYNLKNKTWDVRYAPGQYYSGMVGQNRLLYFPGNTSGKWDVYDPSTLTWSTITPPTQRRNFLMYVVGDLLVSVFGTSVATKMNEIEKALSTVEIYNTKTQKWKTTTHPNRRTKMAVTSASNQFVVFAGGISSTTSTTVADVEIYDVLNSKWYQNYGGELSIPTNDLP